MAASVSELDYNWLHETDIQKNLLTQWPDQELQSDFCHGGQSSIDIASTDIIPGTNLAILNLSAHTCLHNIEIHNVLARQVMLIFTGGLPKISGSMKVVGEKIELSMVSLEGLYLHDSVIDPSITSLKTLSRDAKYNPDTRSISTSSYGTGGIYIRNLTAQVLVVDSAKTMISGQAKMNDTSVISAIGMTNLAANFSSNNLTIMGMDVAIHGQLTVTNNLIANASNNFINSEHIRVEVGSLAVQANQLVNKGTIESLSTGDDIVTSLKAAELNNAGTISSSSQMVLVGNDIANNGAISGNNLHITGKSLINQEKGKLEFTQELSIASLVSCENLGNISSPRLVFSQINKTMLKGSVSTSELRVNGTSFTNYANLNLKALQTNLAGEFYNEGEISCSDYSPDIIAQSFTNKGKMSFGALSWQMPGSFVNEGSFVASGVMQISTKGSIKSTTTLKAATLILKTKSDLTLSGTNEADNFNGEAYGCDISGELKITDSLKLTLPSTAVFTNNGQITVGKATAISAGSIYNHNALLSADLFLRADNFLTNNGDLSGAGAIEMEARQLDNRGTITSGNVILHAHASLTNSKSINASLELVLKAGEKFENDSNISAAKLMDITSPSFSNKGYITVSGVLQHLKGKDFTNEGTINTGTLLVEVSGDFDNKDAVIMGGASKIKANKITTRFFYGKDQNSLYELEAQSIGGSTTGGSLVHYDDFMPLFQFYSIVVQGKLKISTGELSLTKLKANSLELHDTTPDSFMWNFQYEITDNLTFYGDELAICSPINTKNLIVNSKKLANNNAIKVDNLAASAPNGMRNTLQASIKVKNMFQLTGPLHNLSGGTIETGKVFIETTEAVYQQGTFSINSDVDLSKVKRFENSNDMIVKGSLGCKGVAFINSGYLDVHGQLLYTNNQSFTNEGSIVAGKFYASISDSFINKGAIISLGELYINAKTVNSRFIASHGNNEINASQSFTCALTGGTYDQRYKSHVSEDNFKHCTLVGLAEVKVSTHAYSNPHKIKVTGTFELSDLSKSMAFVHSGAGLLGSNSEIGGFVFSGKSFQVDHVLPIKKLKVVTHGNSFTCNQPMNIQGDFILDTQGKITIGPSCHISVAGNLALTGTGTFTNEGSIQVSGSARLGSGLYITNHGLIISGQTMTISTGLWLDNTGGTIHSNQGGLVIHKSSGQNTGSIQNHSGTISTSTGDISIFSKLVQLTRSGQYPASSNWVVTFDKTYGFNVLDGHCCPQMFGVTIPERQNKAYWAWSGGSVRLVVKEGLNPSAEGKLASGGKILFNNLEKLSIYDSVCFAMQDISFVGSKSADIKIVANPMRQYLEQANNVDPMIIGPKAFKYSKPYLDTHLPLMRHCEVVAHNPYPGVERILPHQSYRLYEVEIERYTSSITSGGSITGNVNKIGVHNLFEHHGVAAPVSRSLPAFVHSVIDGVKSVSIADVASGVPLNSNLYHINQNLVTAGNPLAISTLGGSIIIGQSRFETGQIVQFSWAPDTDFSKAQALITSIFAPMNSGKTIGSSYPFIKFNIALGPDTVAAFQPELEMMLITNALFAAGLSSLFINLTPDGTNWQYQTIKQLMDNCHQALSNVNPALALATRNDVLTTLSNSVSLVQDQAKTTPMLCPQVVQIFGVPAWASQLVFPESALSPTGASIFAKNTIDLTVKEDVQTNNIIMAIEGDLKLKAQEIISTGLFASGKDLDLTAIGNIVIESIVTTYRQGHNAYSMVQNAGANAGADLKLNAGGDITLKGVTMHGNFISITTTGGKVIILPIELYNSWIVYFKKGYHFHETVTHQPTVIASDTVIDINGNSGTEITASHIIAGSEITVAAENGHINTSPVYNSHHFHAEKPKRFVVDEVSTTIEPTVIQSGASVYFVSQGDANIHAEISGKYGYIKAGDEQHPAHVTILTGKTFNKIEMLYKKTKWGLSFGGGRMNIA